MALERQEHRVPLVPWTASEVLEFADTRRTSSGQSRRLLYLRKDRYLRRGIHELGGLCKDNYDTTGGAGFSFLYLRWSSLRKRCRGTRDDGQSKLTS